MSSSSHLDRKELKRPDTFLEKAAPVVTYVNNNTKAVLALLALLFALGLGITLYHNHNVERGEAANSALYVAKRDLTTALEKSKKDTDWDQKTKAELERVEKVSTDFRGTRAGFEADLLLGDTYFEHGNSAKALDYFRRAADGAPNRAAKSVALHSLGYAYENAKQYDAAIDAMRQVVATGDKSLKGDALMALARNFALKGDKAKALEQYDQVLKEFPNTALAKSAELQKSLLK